MNCREVHPLISAERDGALDDTRRAALNGHLAQCDACRRVRDDLAAALATWRSENQNATVPDPEREWHAVRRRIRGGVDVADRSTVRSRSRLFVWLAVPLGAAAAIAVALFVSPPVPSSDDSAITPSPHVARVDSVETPGANSSTMVFVDDKSGWLIVWADAHSKSG